MGLIYDRRGAAPSASRSQLGCPPSAEVLHQAAVQGRSRWLGVSVLLTDIEIVLCFLPPLSFGLRSFHVLLSFYCSMRFRVPWNIIRGWLLELGVDATQDRGGVGGLLSSISVGIR